MHANGSLFYLSSITYQLVRRGKCGLGDFRRGRFGGKIGCSYSVIRFTLIKFQQLEIKSGHRWNTLRSFLGGGLNSWPFSWQLGCGWYTFSPNFSEADCIIHQGLSIQFKFTVINLTATKGPHKGGCGVLIACMIKCFPVSNIAVIYYKQAVEFYTNWSGCYQLLWHFILILKINLETGKKVQNYCFKRPVQAYLQSDRGSIVFRETAHFTGIKVSSTSATTARSQFPTWVLASQHSPDPWQRTLSICIFFLLTWGNFSTEGSTKYLVEAI